MPATTLLRDQTRTVRRAWRRTLRRHRRPLAAALAALAVLVALSALRTPPAIPAAAPVADPSVLRVGEVEVPIELATGSVTSILHAGDVVDVVALGDDGTTRVVARSARVVGRPPSPGGLGSSASALVVVAVPDDDALPLVSSSLRDELAVIVRRSA